MKRGAPWSTHVHNIGCRSRIYERQPRMYRCFLKGGILECSTEKLFCVCAGGMSKNMPRLALLDDFAVPHDEDASCDGANEREIVRNE